MKPTIVIIGAGSVEFTRELLGDILSFPELGSARVVLHDIDAERLETAEAIARATARAAGAEPEVVATADRRRALDGADYVINVIAVGMHEATVRDFEIPARYGLNQTIGDTIGVGGIFRGLRTFPVLAGIARDMAEVCPDAWLLNYTNPMAMNISYLHRGRAEAEGARAVPLGVLDDGRPVRARSTCPTTRCPTGRRASTTRPGCCGGNAAARTSTRCSTSASPPIRSCAGACASTCTGGWATTRPRPASTAASTCPGTCTTPTRSSGCGSTSASTCRSARPTSPNTTGCERNWLTRTTLPIDTSSTEYAPQVIHSLETGTPRVISANVANDGLITNLPDGVAVEVPTLLDALGAHPMKVGDLPPQCAALNRSFLGPVDLTVRAAVDGDPRLVRAAAMVDPNTAATLTVDQIWELCDELTTAHGDLLPEPLRSTLARDIAN